MSDSSQFPPIWGLLENTLIDWEGKIAAIIFLPGCNFRCRYCHAAHLLRGGPEHEVIPPQTVFDLVRNRRGWIDGVVVSGGEPLLHPTLPNLIQALKDLGVGVKLDTNGSSPDKLAALIDEGLIDFVAMDVKAPLTPEKYGEIAGVDVDVSAIRRSIDVLLQGRIDYEFRTTVCPVFTDADDVRGIAEAARGAKRLVLQQFRPQNLLDESLLDVKPYPIETLREFADIARPFVRECYVRGEKGK